MNINKIVLAFVALAVLAFSCASEEDGPIVDLTDVETGAYPRLIDETSSLLNLFDAAGSTYTYNVEMIDIEGGATIAEYVVDLFYDDNNPEDGDNSSGPFEVVNLTASSFTPNERGFLTAPTVSLNGADMLNILGLTADDLTAGDELDFVGRVVLTDGRIFSRANSSPTIVGAAFRGHFNFTMPAGCPSDLAQTGIAYSTTDFVCAGSTRLIDGGPGPLTGTVDIEAVGTGTYSFTDWAFGTYTPCYNASPATGLTFKDVCLEVSFDDKVDSFGDTWTYESSINGNEWIINWSNTFNESGSTVLTFPEAVPFVLAD